MRLDRFFAIVYAPYLLILLPQLMFFGIGGLINLLIGISEESTGGVSVGLFALAITAFPCLVILVSHRLSNRISTAANLGLLLYISQAAIVLVPLGCFMISLGGMSMARVDNGGMSLENYAEAADGMLLFFLFFQIFLLPWTFYVRKKLMRIQAAETNQSAQLNPAA